MLLRFFICIFLASTILMAYRELGNSEFISLDDNLYVTDNSHVQTFTLKTILWAFTSIHAGYWIPVTWFSHTLDCHLYGLNPRGHHFTNLIFHIANAFLLFILFHRMTSAPWQSGFLAGLFALHPLRVESVAWVAERKDVLGAFFLFLAMWAYLRYVQKPKSNRYLFVIFCFLLALMSKPMTVTLPFALLLLDYWPLGRAQFGETPPCSSPFVSKSMGSVSRKALVVRLVLEKIPLFLLAAALGLFTLFSQRVGGAVSSLDKLPLGLRIGNALVTYVNYIAKMIWPQSLAVLYPHPTVQPLWKVAAATSLLVMITVFAFLSRRKSPYLIVGWLWYLGTLLPMIGLIQSGVQGMADRFTYIPMIGLLIMLIYGIPDAVSGWRYSKVAFATSGTLCLLILMICTASQVQVWRSSVTLFSHTLKVTANNSVIENNLGVTLAGQGKDYDAATHFTKALEINPYYSDAHHNLAVLLARQGKDQEAVAHFVEALREKPSSSEPHNDLGVLLIKQGKIQEAILHFAEALTINPNYAGAYFNLGVALVRQGRNNEAIHYLDKALRINPRDDKVHNSLGVALAALGKNEDAICHYDQALKINPGNTDAHYNLGCLLTLQGRGKEAIPHYHEILRTNPSDARAHYELGAILARQKERRQAVIHFTEAVRIAPHFGEAHLALGVIHLETGKKELALRQYKILQTVNKDLAESLYKKISRHRNLNG